jgi:hypothetical protein
MYKVGGAPLAVQELDGFPQGDSRARSYLLSSGPLFLPALQRTTQAYQLSQHVCPVPMWCYLSYGSFDEKI